MLLPSLLLWCSLAFAQLDCASLNCTVAPLGPLTPFCENNSMVLTATDVVDLIEEDIWIPGDLKMYNDSTLQISSNTLDVRGSFHSYGSTLSLADAIATVEENLALDAYSSLYIDKSSEILISECADFGQAKLFFVVQTEDILALAGTIDNSSFHYGSAFYTSATFSCLGDKFSSVQPYLPAYRCTNISCSGFYNATYIQVELMVGTGAANCQDDGNALSPYLAISLWSIVMVYLL